MKTNEELNREFHRTLEESDEKHAAAVRRREAKKREIFALIVGKKPGKNDNK